MKLSKFLEAVAFTDGATNNTNTLVFNSREKCLLLIDSGSWQDVQSGNFDQVPAEIINELIDKKILVDQSVDELADVLAENRDAIANEDKLYLVIQPTANCSLGCGYCGQAHNNTLMSESAQDGLIQFAASRIRPHHKYIAISWFGGEPLMGIKAMRKISSRLRKLAQEKNLGYVSSVVTNGLSLNNNMVEELITEHLAYKIEVTLDGTEEMHDQRRHLKTGEKTFSKIYNNLKNIVENYSDKILLSIRCNVDDRNLNNVPELIDLLHRDGILPKVMIYFAPVHSWGNDAHKHIESKKYWSQKQIEWFISLNEKNIKIDLLPQRKKNLCVAVDDNGTLIDPYGGVYKCTEVTLTPTYNNKNGKNIHKLGDVTIDPSDIDYASNQFGGFNEVDVIQNFPCAQCSLLPLCGGMCPKEWVEGRIPCPPIRYNIKERMLLSYAWNQSNFDVVEDEAKATCS